MKPKSELKTKSIHISKELHSRIPSKQIKIFTEEALEFYLAFKNANWSEFLNLCEIVSKPHKNELINFVKKL